MGERHQPAVSLRFPAQFHPISLPPVPWAGYSPYLIHLIEQYVPKLRSNPAACEVLPLELTQDSPTPPPVAHHRLLRLSVRSLPAIPLFTENPTEMSVTFSLQSVSR